MTEKMETGKEEEQQPRLPPGAGSTSRAVGKAGKRTFAQYQEEINALTKERMQLDEAAYRQKFGNKPRSYRVQSFNAPAVTAYIKAKSKPKAKNVYFFKQGRSWGVYVEG